MVTTDMLAALPSAPVAPVTPAVPVVTEAPVERPDAPKGWGDVSKRFTEAALAANINSTDSIVDAIEADAAIADGETELTIPGLDAPLVPANEAATDPAPPATDAPADPESPPATAAPAEEVHTVVLKDRNGVEKEIDVSDPKIAEILRANANDGMRKMEYLREKKALDQKQAEFNELETQLQVAPETVVNMMDAATQLRALEWLLVNRWDDVKDTVEKWYGDPQDRREAQLNMREKLDTSTREAKQHLAVKNQRMAVATAIESLIPENATQEDAQDFYDAVAARLGAVENQRKRAIHPDEVPELAERFRARYGFTGGPAAPEPAVDPAITAAPRLSLVPTTPAVAAPVGATAEAVAKRAVATAARMKALPAQQAAAAVIAPSSIGAAPAVKPPAKSYSEASSRFVEASNRLKAAGAR